MPKEEISGLTGRIMSGVSVASLIDKYPWYEWLCHTNFSFLIGSSHPEEYVRRAIELGYKGIGIADYDGIYGIVRAWRARRSLKKRSVDCKLFYGAEIHLHHEPEVPLLLRDTLVVFAQTLRGYHNLCRLISHAQKRGKHQAALSLQELLSSDVADLVCMQPMRGIMRSADISHAYQRASLLKEKFNRNFFLIISRHLNPSEDRWIPHVKELAKALACGTIFSQDPYFCRPEDKILNDVMHAIRLNRKVDDIAFHHFINDQRSLHSLEILERLYGSLDSAESALRRSHELAASFSFDLDQLCYRYPQEMIPEGMSAFEYLRQLSWQGAHAYYGEDIPAKVRELLTRELALVTRLGFADYFLTVWDIVSWARKQQILCQGRGSAANSAICFVLGITAVDPMKFELLFERFISAERGDPPDIDVDFEHERREEVIQYIYARYGRERAAMVANVITYRSRSAIADVGKALGIEARLLRQAAASQEFREARRLSVMPKELSPPQPPSFESVPPHLWSLWCQLSQRLKGFPRHMGIHVGGFVLTDKTIDHFCPQEPATMEERTVIQWSKEDIEALSFFKIDILALGMLSALRKGFDLVHKHYETRLDLACIPQDDPATYAMIQRAETVGTFQIESRAQMSMLPRLRPQKFYDLVVQVGIIRPGPIQGGLIHPFLRRRRGEEPITYAHPELRPILERTLGVPLFQEQIMRVAMAVGGFSPGEADELRRFIGSFAMKKNLAPLIARLTEGMQQRAIPQVFIDQTVSHLKGFAEYGFPESHAVSFALLAYASCYLKCHFPAAFFTALLNSQPMGFYSPHALIQTARREGVQVHPVCVSRSQWECHLEAAGEDSPYGMRLGLCMVGGLTRAGAEKLVAAREQKKRWHDLDDFIRSSQLYGRDLTALAAANALLVFGIERRSAIWLAAAAPLAPLFEESHSLSKLKLPPESTLQQLQRDFAAFHTTLGPHPATIIKNELWHYAPPVAQLHPARALMTRCNNERVTVFGMVLVRQAPPTAKGMVFMTLEDESGFINLAFTPNIYKKFKNIIDTQGFLCATGRLQREAEGHSLLVALVHPYLDSSGKVIHMKSTEPAPAAPRSALPLQSLYPARNYM
jgi:error-prone DNA polymerase